MGKDGKESAVGCRSEWRCQRCWNGDIRNRRAGYSAPCRQRSRAPSSTTLHQRIHMRHTPHAPPPGRISPPLSAWPSCTLSAGQQGATNANPPCGRVRRSADGLHLAPHLTSTPYVRRSENKGKKKKKGGEWGAESGASEADAGSREVYLGELEYLSPDLAGSRQRCCFFSARM